MKTGELQQLFGVSASTIKNWVTEFADFFSETAKGAEARHRRFDGADFLVMATIAELSQRHKLPYTAIREKLQDGYRVEDTTAQTVGYEDGRLIPAAAVEQIIDSAELRSELEALKMDHTRLLSELEKRDQRLAEKEQHNEKLQAEIKELQRALGKLEGRLQEIEKPTKRRWWG